MNFASLKLTLIGSRVWRRADDTGELVALYAVEAPNGETGHYAYEMRWDKRDVEEERVFTDNPNLVVVDDCSPMAYNAFSITEDHGPDPRKHEAYNKCIGEAWESH